MWVKEMKTLSVDFEMKGLKAFKQLQHQILAGVPLKHLNSKATINRMVLEETLELNWIIKASSVVRSPETFRDLRNLAWLGSEPPFKATVYPSLKKLRFSIRFGDVSQCKRTDTGRVQKTCQTSKT